MRARPDKVRKAGLCANTNPEAFALFVEAPKCKHGGSIRWDAVFANPLIFERVYNNPALGV